MSLKTASARGGLVGAVLFIACVSWVYFLSPEAASLHLKLLPIAWPGFSFSASGLIIGLVESYVYGWVFGWVIIWIVSAKRS